MLGRALALTAVSLSLVACETPNDHVHRGGAVELPGTPVTLAYLTPSGHPSGVEWNTAYVDPVRVVVRDQAAWGEAWAMLVGSEVPAAPVPSVDFTQDMVVIAGIGRSGGARAMRMPVAAVQDDGSLRVAVEDTTLGDGCVWGPMETRQASAARVPRADSVTFVDFVSVRKCE
ncbi:MAG: hypothetical protein QM704_21495 [Anaeromyxobacteraceae bacterium]